MARGRHQHGDDRPPPWAGGPAWPAAPPPYGAGGPASPGDGGQPAGPGAPPRPAAPPHGPAGPAWPGYGAPPGAAGPPWPGYGGAPTGPGAPPWPGYPAPPGAAGPPWPGYAAAPPHVPAPGEEFLPVGPGGAPAVPRSGLLLALGTIALVAAAGLAFVAMTVGGLYAMANNHRIREAPRFTDPDVVAAVAGACAGLAATLDTITPDDPADPPSVRARRIRRENAAIAQLVSDVRADAGHGRLAAEPYALDWLNAWEELTGLREDWAREVETGDAGEFTVSNDPLNAGPVARVDTVVNACDVPDRLRPR